MVAKVCVLILALGATALTVLSLRQDRLRSVNELARIQQRMLDHDRTLFEIRTQIADCVTPDRVEAMALAAGATRPMIPEAAPAPLAPERAIARGETTPGAPQVRRARLVNPPARDPN